MKLCYFNDYRLGVIKGDQVVDVTDAVKDVPHLEARDLIIFFCRWQSPLFVFLGAVFIANAAFNTLGKPHLSTMLNWSRATLGTIPLVLAGAWLDGARGALTGHMLGGVLFGILSVWLAYRLIDQIAQSLGPPRSG